MREHQFWNEILIPAIELVIVLLFLLLLMGLHEVGVALLDKLF